jgi:hypothetical protein
MRQGVIAGLFYFAAVFALGAVLGALRTLYVVPEFGQALAVAIELPFILIFSWFVCHWLMIKCGVESWQDRLAMAAEAFVLLLAAEWVTRFLFNKIVLGDGTLPPAVATQSFADGLGIAAQVAFGLLPLIMRTDSLAETWPKPPSR